MSRFACRALGACAIASVLILTAFGGDALAAKSTKKVDATATLRSLVTQTVHLPKAASSKLSKARLLRRARDARRVARRNPCLAVSDLSSYRKTLRGARIRSTVKGSKLKAKLRGALAALGPASLKASRKLLSDKRTKRCGGGVIPSRLAAVKTTVMKSDENGMLLRVQLPGLDFVPRTGGGKSWTQLTLPDTDSPGTPGKPGIPVVSSTYGVPDGATVSVTPGSSESYTIDGVDVYPAQPESMDTDPPKPDFLAGQFASKPFTIDPQAYKSDAFSPAPAAGQVLGTMRDVVVGGLQVPAAQFDPAAHKLKVFNSVDVKVAFNGGPKTFSPELNSPWEFAQRTLLASLLNVGIIRSRIPFPFRRCGEEMLVITNPATQAAADTFATAKRSQGMRTNVFDVGSAAGQIGTTAAQIQAFIRSHLTAPLCIHPSYVTILGDDDLVPTNAGIDGIPSDLPYTWKNNADELPDVAIGRIIGNDAGAVGTAVNKIVGYETTAPTANGMLNKATVAADFQDDDLDGTENRTFIQFAETVRNGLVARGVSVDRVYGESPVGNPKFENDGTPLPAALKKPTFGWNGTGAQITADWNQGRFLMVHRDHGWSDGWGVPAYGTADVDALTNGSLLPVLLSINCSSGAYDYDETSFAGEALVNPNGGAVGVFGDTRDSPSWHNTQIALGYVDALLPSVLPGEGPATKQTTGNALINGKLRLVGLSPPATDSSTRDELYLWHYFGDPSMQMWGGGSPPFVFNPALVNAIYKPGPISIPDPPPYEVSVSLPPGLAGVPISLLQNGQVVGKQFAGDDGTVTIDPSITDGSPAKPGELTVAFTAPGAQPVQVPVSGVGPVPTTLTQTCPSDVLFDTQGPTTITVTGTLTGAPAGTQLNVTFLHPQPPEGSTNPAPPPQTVVATTGPGGAWTASVTTTNRQDLGQWSVSSSYPGDATYAASTVAQPCSFSVHLPTPT